ncbi:hypothetical protein HPT27_17335 [Permianibacter sp. IMCC34836]|uniref:hypothetical protein n=1 Tax=Permianibacter fluminis TaxID=2738515 RepID=UPI001554DB5D|nr:hypothetical protein [Permianibacter fluminis]NQD38784.1 hypothetical protein [Permianibacter fluminis]
MTEPIQFQIDAQLAALSKAGVALSGSKVVELFIVAPTKAVADDLRQRFYHPDGSMNATCDTAENGDSVVRLRIELELKASVLCSYLWSFSKIASECGGRLESWKVVL